MTRCSRAASSASSRSWRSSLRTSRSPTRGLRAVRSSPSRSMWRGKLPSSSPSRHTTRCGMERIGHQRAHGQVAGAEVRPRRLALQALGQDRADVVAAEGDGADRVGRRRLGDEVVEQRGELRPLPGVARRRRRQRVGDRGPACRPRRRTVRVARERVERGLQPVDELGQAAGQLDVAAVDVVEREGVAEQPLAVLGHGHAEQDPVEAGLPGVGPDVGRAGTASGARRRSPSARSASSTHSSSRNRSSSLKRKRRRTGSRPARSSTSVAVIRAVASSRTSASTPITGLVWRSERSARRISSCRVRAARRPRSVPVRRTSPG